MENGGKGVEGAEAGAILMKKMKKMNGKLKVQEIGGVQNQGGLSQNLFWVFAKTLRLVAVK